MKDMQKNFVWHTNLDVMYRASIVCHGWTLFLCVYLWLQENKKKKNDAVMSNKDRSSKTPWQQQNARLLFNNKNKKKKTLPTNCCTSLGNIQARLPEKTDLKNTKISQQSGKLRDLERIRLGKTSRWLDSRGHGQRIEGGGEEVDSRGIVWNNRALLHTHTLNKHLSSL